MLKYFRSSDLAHEIASAVFRVSALVRHERLRKELEEGAVELVKGIYPEKADILERMVRLAGAVGEASEINTRVLCRELENLRIMLNAEISESFSGVSENIDLREVFAGKTPEKEGNSKEEFRNKRERERAILEYIRKFPNGCRMRQLSVEFANFSERTVRTDVQKLIGRGLVEKIGSKTGPFSYFRVVGSAHSTLQRVQGRPEQSRGATSLGQASSHPSQNATAGTAPQGEIPVTSEESPSF